MSDVSPADSGLASGLVNTSFMMGGALGLAVLASLAAARTLSLSAAGAATTAAINGGYHLAFVLGAVCAAGAALGHRGEGSLDLVRCAYVDAVDLDPQGTLDRRDGVAHEAVHDRICRMSDDGHARDLGHGVLQYFEPFLHELGAIPGQSREVPARLREVGDDARTYQVSGSRHNGDGSGRLLGRQHPGRRPGEEEVGHELDQLGGESG